MVLEKSLNPSPPLSAPGDHFLLYLLFLDSAVLRAASGGFCGFGDFSFPGSREMRDSPAPWERKKPPHSTSTLRTVLKCLYLLR